MFPAAKYTFLIITTSLTILNGCSPKPNSEPSAAYFVESNKKNEPSIIKTIASFSKNKGYIPVGKIDDINDYYVYQFYRIDSQILVMKSRNKQGIDVIFYKSGGPISKSDLQMKGIGEEFKKAIEDGGVFISESD
ncbi:hypothetical protein [Brevundimonas diminuta]|uniref:hypothetical protein n=1 Tax=Brevundimonas diminuta TaxID=293 RepID=UPI0028ACBA2B|nr:hypothetical protein [Brevundimonas diminuta]